MVNMHGLNRLHLLTNKTNYSIYEKVFFNTGSDCSIPFIWICTGAENGNGNGNGNSNNGFTVVNSTESEPFTMDFTHPCIDVITLTGTRHISSHGKVYPDGSDDIKTSNK